MEIIYTFYFFAFLKKVIKKLLTFCYWKDMKKFSVLLMILAIVCALFADKIDMAVKGNKKVKKVIVVFSVGVLLVCTIAIVASILA